MAPKKKSNDSPRRTVADNRKARYEYEFIEKFEAGLQLTGTEVKSLREGKAMIAESYASAEGDQIYLINSHIPEYLQGNRFNHEARRPRRLLMHRREINKLIGAIQREGMTLVPTKLYFNDRGRAKIEIALSKGKKIHDKRASEKARDWQRDKARIMRDRG